MTRGSMWWCAAADRAMQFLQFPPENCPSQRSLSKPCYNLVFTFFYNEHRRIKQEPRRARPPKLILHIDSAQTACLPPVTGCREAKYLLQAQDSATNRAR